MRKLSIFFIFINFLFGFDLNEFAKDVADKSYVEIDTNNTKKHVTIQLKKGWNLLNLPLYEIIRDKKKLGDYKAIWIYKNGEYITPKYPKASEPFWIYANSDIEIENIGRSYNIDLSALPIGWNIVGNGSEINSSEIENYSNTYWVYRDNKYEKNPSIIYPNEGFYIKIDEELKALNSSKKDEIVDFKSAFNYNFSDIKKDKNKKLIVLYMVGSDLESSYKSATKDLIELSDGYKSLTEAQKRDIEMIVVFGGSKATNWNGIHIATIENILRDSENKKFGDDKYLFSDDKLNMGEINTLTTLLKELKNSFDDYKSKTVIFWNHGGAYFGYGDDNNFKDKLTIEEIEIAFKRADMSFDMIGFDACLMANYEVATILKPYTKYLIASEETEPGHGWNWEFLIQQFSKDIDLESFGKSLIDNYVDDKNYKTIKKGKTLSIMNLNHYDELDKSINSATSHILDKLKSSQDELNNLAFAVENGQKFGAVKGNEDGVSVDLKDTIQILNTKTTNNQLKDELKKINSNFEKMVIYSKTDGTRSGSYGISISPLNKLISIAKNIDISTSNGWLELSHEYTKNIVNSRSINTQDNSIVATKTSFGAILEQIFILLGEEDRDLNEFSKWNGEWFYIVNLSNGTGIPLPLFEYDTIGDIKIYRSPIDLNDEAHVLDLIYDEKNKKVISYSFIQVWFDDGWQLRMDKEYKNINDGDKISITAPIVELKTYKILDSMWLGDINVEENGIYIDKFSVDYFGDIATLGELIYSKDSKGNVNILDLKQYTK